MMTTSSTARFRVAVNAVIERDGLYLLARRRDIGWWHLVGGALEYDETIQQGLLREVREEIGASIDILLMVLLLTGKNFFVALLIVRVGYSIAWRKKDDTSRHSPQRMG